MIHLSRDIQTNFKKTAGRDRRQVSSRWQSIIDHYNEPHRHYHSWRHIQDCHALLWNMQERIGKVDDIQTTFLAIVYHDVIYDVQTRDNEEQSAAYFRGDAFVLGFDERIIESVQRLILESTYSNGSSRSIFGDIDLSSLAAEPAVFRQQSDLIWREQVSVVEETYWRSRLSLMKRFLSSDKIYYSELFSTLEAQARANLESEIRHCEERLRFS